MFKKRIDIYDNQGRKIGYGERDMTPQEIEAGFKGFAELYQLIDNSGCFVALGYILLSPIIILYYLLRWIIALLEGSKLIRKLLVFTLLGALIFTVLYPIYYYWLSNNTIESANSYLEKRDWETAKILANQSYNEFWKVHQIYSTIDFNDYLYTRFKGKYQHIMYEAHYQPAVQAFSSGEYGVVLNYFNELQELSKSLVDEKAKSLINKSHYELGQEFLQRGGYQPAWDHLQQCDQNFLDRNELLDNILEEYPIIGKADIRSVGRVNLGERYQDKCQTDYDYSQLISEIELLRNKIRINFNFPVKECNGYFIEGNAIYIQVGEEIFTPIDGGGAFFHPGNISTIYTVNAFYKKVKGWLEFPITPQLLGKFDCFDLQLSDPASMQGPMQFLDVCIIP